MRVEVRRLPTRGVSEYLRRVEEADAAREAGRRGVEMFRVR